MNILFVGASGDRYGADAVLRAIANHVRGRGGTSRLVLPERGAGVSAAEEDGLQVLVDDTVVLRKADLNASGLLSAAVRAVPRLVSHTQAIRARKPDVVWVNTVTLPLWLLASRLARVRVVCHTHEIVGGSRSFRRLLYSILFLADRVLTVSEAARSDILDAYPSLADRVEVALNPSFAIDKPIPVRPGGERDIVVIGRISARKGLGVLMDALDYPELSSARLTVHVCGTPYRSEAAQAFACEIKARATRVNADVRFHGFLSTELALSLGGIVALPSTEPEACPLVVAESLTAGRVVVASGWGGVSEISGGAALLVPPGDAEALGSALARLLHDAHERRLWKDRGLARATRLSRDPYFAKIRSFIRAVTAGHGSPTI